MTGYSFHCTPCGHPHAGDCPPKPAEVVAPEEWQVEVVVGSRWKGQRRPIVATANNPRGLVGTWQPSGWNGGYEVLAIISDGTTPRSRIQVRAWQTPAAVVWTLPIEYWFEEGWFNDTTQSDERMVPWT